jgi:rhomboid protease GluP
LLVHSEGWHQIALNFPALLFLGAFFESKFGARGFLLVYFSAAFAGEVAGYFWQPFGAGNSIASAGLLGGLAVWLWRMGVLQSKFGAALIFVGAGWLIWRHDIHGPPILVGALLTGVLLRRRLPRESPSSPNSR